MSCFYGTTAATVNVLKFRTLSLSVLNKMLVFMAGIHKKYVRIANRKILIRLLLQKQSDLGLRCLSMPLGQTTSVEILEHLP